MNIRKMNKALAFLREKYGAAKGEIALRGGARSSSSRR